MQIATVSLGESAYTVDSMTGENIGKKPESTIAWPAGCDIDASARSDGPVGALGASSLISTLPSPVVQTSSIKDIESCGLGFWFLSFAFSG